MVVQTVPSVGPYALNKYLPLDQQRAISAESSSPAEITIRNKGNVSGRRSASAEGGSVTVVMACSCKNCCRRAAGQRHSCGIRYKWAPLRRVMKTSETEASKLKEAN